MAGIELAEMIAELREELTRARDAGAGKDLQFVVGPVELEVTMTVSREGGPSAKVRFWVVEVGGEAKLSSASTQRLKLVLTPESSGGGTVKVAGATAKDEH